MICPNELSRAANNLITYYPFPRPVEFHDDFPQTGVRFCDILPVLRDPIAFESLITHLLHHIFNVTLPRLREGAKDPRAVKIDAVVGLDARGFLFGPQLAQRLGAAFLPVRKRGKLPGENVQAEYIKEYGKVRTMTGTRTYGSQRRIILSAMDAVVADVSAPNSILQDVFELPSRSIATTHGGPANVIIVDDLIATGGSAGAAGELVRKVGAKTVEYLFVVAIPFLKGEEKLDAPSYQCVSQRLFG